MSFFVTECVRLINLENIFLGVDKEKRGAIIKSYQTSRKTGK